MKDHASAIAGPHRAPLRLLWALLPALALVAGCGSGRPEVRGCGDATLYANPSDPGAEGAWAVGVRTAIVAGLTTETWYPAEPGTDADVSPASYDIRQWLSPSEAAKIPDSSAPSQVCDCFRDLPIDAGRGPYPVIVFIHGTAGFRTQSLHFMTHWASRGFVVVAADYPGLFLGDVLTNPAGGITSHPEVKARALIEALDHPAGNAAFLDGRIDMAQLGMAGHSAGAFALMGFGDVAKVLVPMAGSGVMPGGALQSTLVMGGLDDGVVAPKMTLAGYDAAPAPKRFVGIADAGHLVFSDLCAIKNAAGQNILEIGEQYHIMNAELASILFDGCGAGYLTPEQGWDIVNYASTAVFEATLQCHP